MGQASIWHGDCPYFSLSLRATRVNMRFSHILGHGKLIFKDSSWLYF